jgi:hypothetical protein
MLVNVNSNVTGSSTKAVVVMDGEKLTISAETTTTGVLVGTISGGGVAVGEGIRAGGGAAVVVDDGTGVNVGVGVIVVAGPVV